MSVAAEMTLTSIELSQKQVYMPYSIAHSCESESSSCAYSQSPQSVFDIAECAPDTFSLSAMASDNVENTMQKVKQEPVSEYLMSAQFKRPCINEFDDQLAAELMTSLRQKLGCRQLSNVPSTSNKQPNVFDCVSRAGILGVTVSEDTDNRSGVDNQTSIESSVSHVLSSQVNDSVAQITSGYTSQSGIGTCAGSSPVQPDSTCSSQAWLSPSEEADLGLNQASEGGYQTPGNGSPSCVQEGSNSVDKGYQKPHHLLPPCRVCGDKASGFHYGANTCEACKGFFRRSLKKSALEFKCSGDNQCTIQKGRRNNCPKCRYNKCLSVGMSKEAIKTGRYTHEKRTKDIVEVKQLSGQASPDMITSPKLSPNVVSPTPFETVVPKPILPKHQVIIDTIYTAHKTLFPFWHQLLDSGALPGRLRDYAEKYKVKKSLLEDMETTAKEEQIEASLSAGLEVEDRSITIDKLTKHIELAIMVFVKFAKVVPGFCDLTLNDQASLVKLSRFEIWMVGAHQFIDYDLQVVSGPRGNSYHMEELAKVLDPGFVEAMFEFARTLQLIKLSNEETALLKCVTLTFSDREQLQEPAKVEAIQLRLIECLQSLLNSSRRFSQVINALVRLRDLTEWHKSISENLVLEWPTIKHNPLLLEIMSV